jgi:16S rRNA U1498 N3-methylase RsmE
MGKPNHKKPQRSARVVYEACNQSLSEKLTHITYRTGKISSDDNVSDSRCIYKTI